MAQENNISTKKVKVKDFKSDQEVRWCPGCGDHIIMNAVQRAMVQLGVPREKHVVVSGIGCSSRFPYYMGNYGFHGIHGRASAISTGVKLANPDLYVWEVTGDGDALAIGGNHFIHTIRRNININLLLFNNKIYGLTKGQYSPTSDLGQKTKTSPYGTIEAPFDAGELTLGAQGNFYARSIDNMVKLNTEILVEAAQHKGTSIIEFIQNCIIYNPKAHDVLADKNNKKERQLILKHGEPMIFGENNDKGIIMDGMELKVAKIGENGVSQDDILIHDAHNPNPILHWMLINMKPPEFPMAFGIIRSVQADTYEDRLISQIDEVKSQSEYKKLEDLMHSGTTWEIEN